jgi:DNA-binding NarL/FixJ family response regulator
MKKHPTLIIADDHPILLKGLEDSLTTRGYKVLAAVTDGAAALNAIKTYQPDIALLDIEMPVLNAFEVIEKYTQQEIHTAFVLLTSHKERGFVAQAQKLHIKGYLLKDEPLEELERCLKLVHKGGQYFSKTFQEVLDDEVLPEMRKIKRLTPSERIILGYIAKGFSSKDIAQELSISIRTVQKHRSNIITKLGIASNDDALTTWVKDNAHFL